MKKYTLLLLALLPLYILNSQPVYKGILLKNFNQYQPGDTLKVYGAQSDYPDHPKFLVKSHYGYIYIGSESIKVMDEGMDYWEKLWFENRAAYIHNNGWKIKQRDLLMNDFRTYMTEMEKNELLIRDEFIADYFRQLVLMIHPGKLIRPDEKQIDIVILSSPESEIFAFNCGTIVITTSKIAEIENEEQLVKLLSRYVAHLVLEDNLDNLIDEMEAQEAADFFVVVATIASAIAMTSSNIKRGTSYRLGDALFVGDLTSTISHALISSIGADYTCQQVSRAKHNAAITVSNLQAQGVQFNEGKAYTIRITPVLKNLAWQSYYQNDYDRSREILDRIFEIGIEDEEDYLLLAKLYRATIGNEEGLQLALDAINKAEDLDDFNFVEVLFEKGMILMWMGEYLEAKIAFNEFLSVTEEVGGDPDEIKEAKRMVIRCGQLLGER
ncbi:MAG: hypothetical protein ISS19_18345 [Bacteroidales bacterium]|nr:hypothetical protein [Bacteroidales bacterium]